MSHLLIIDQCSTFFMKIEEGLRHFHDVKCIHAKTESDARDLLKSHTVSKVLVENYSAEGNGVDFISYLRDHYPDAIPVLMSTSREKELVYGAFKAGAQGFLLKPMNMPDLLHHLEGWMIGIVPISPCVAAKLINRYCKIAEQSPSLPSCNNKKLTGFSKREHEVMNLMISGTDTKGMAIKLCISHSTVATHIKNIYCKLNVSNRVAAVNAMTHVTLPEKTTPNGQNTEPISRNQEQHTHRRRSTDN